MFIVEGRNWLVPETFSWKVSIQNMLEKYTRTIYLENVSSIEEAIFITKDLLKPGEAYDMVTRLTAFDDGPEDNGDYLKV